MPTMRLKGTYPHSQTQDIGPLEPVETIAGSYAAKCKLCGGTTSNLIDESAIQTSETNQD